jgi:hypothetical protein
MKSNGQRRAPSFALAVLLLAGALAGCNTDGTGAPGPVAQAPAPMTRTDAARECWMATEHGRNDLPLDKRADIVDKCIKDKMSAAKPSAAQANTAPKTPPTPSPKPRPSPPKSKT